MITSECIRKRDTPKMVAFTPYAKADAYFPLFCPLSILKPFPFQMKNSAKSGQIFNGFNTN